MGKSFIFKDIDGRAVGYLQQIQDCVRCSIRANAKEQAHEILLFFEDGHCSKKAIQADGCEHEWIIPRGSISGACDLVNSSVAADTGAESRSRFAQYRQKSQAAEAAKQQPREEEKRAEPTQNEARHALKRVFPQRRWPPLPCCPQTRYAQGMWQLDHSE